MDDYPADLPLPEDLPPYGTPTAPSRGFESVPQQDELLGGIDAYLAEENPDDDD